MPEPRWPHGDRLRGLMRSRGLTPADLSARSGVPRTTIYGLLAGECEPLYRTLASLLIAMDRTHADLESAAPLAAESDPDRHSRSAGK